MKQFGTDIIRRNSYVNVRTAESEAYRAVSIWVPIGIDVGTAESEAHRAVSIWYQLVWTSGQMKVKHIVRCRYGTNWCGRRDR